MLSPENVSTILPLKKNMFDVVLFDEDSPADLLDEIKPDVYTKGADYTIETLPERDIIEKNGIKTDEDNLPMDNACHAGDGIVQ